MPATPTITPTRMFVLKGSAAAKSVCGSRFYFILCLGTDICCLTCRKKYENRTAVAKVTANVIRGTLF